MWLAAIAAAALAGGSFLPWLKVTAPFVGTITKSGIEGGDGWGSVVAALLVAVAAWQLSQKGRDQGIRILLLVGGLGAAVLTIYEVVDLSSKFSDMHADPDIGDAIVTGYGMGLYALAAGSALAIIAALVAPSAQAAT